MTGHWEAQSDDDRFAVLDAALTQFRIAPIAVWTATRPASVVAGLRTLGFDGETITSQSTADPAALGRHLPQAPASCWRIGQREPLRMRNWDLRLLDSDGS